MSKSKFALSSVPTTTFADVGGLEDAKREIYNSLIMPLSNQSKFAMRRTGMLFYGPPGCGKSLLAKAIANELQCQFLSVKGPELMNMYVGETERNVREIFQQARSCKRAVVFFDELDAMAPRRDSDGSMGRVVSQLLAEMDGAAATNADGRSLLFVISATNRPDLLDASLLRPGRFDRLVYLETAQTRSAQLAILQAATRKLNLHASVHLPSLCERIPLGRWSGADFAALCTDALMHAVAGAVSRLDVAVASASGGKGK